VLAQISRKWHCCLILHATANKKYKFANLFVYPQDADIDLPSKVISEYSPIVKLSDRVIKPKGSIEYSMCIFHHHPKDI